MLWTFVLGCLRGTPERAAEGPMWETNVPKDRWRCAEGSALPGTSLFIFIAFSTPSSFPKASDITFHFYCRHSIGKRSPLSENLAFQPAAEMWDKILFPTKAFPESSHLQSSHPASRPEQLNSTVGVSPVSPKASPDYGADRRGPVLGLQQKHGLGSRFLLSSNIMQISKSN